MHVLQWIDSLTLDDSVNRARLLAESTVDTLGHVDIVSSGPPAAIGAHLRLNGDGLGGTDGLAQLARDAPLFARGVPAQQVLAPEPRTQGALFERVVDGDFGLHRDFGG